MSGPFLGVFFHWLGGIASGSFYVPYRFVQKWSWEVMWLIGGVFSWIVMPWLMGFLLTNDLVSVLWKSIATEPKAVYLAFIFGMMWGMGGLTFGLTMRYLGMSLGMAVALGYCTVFGFLMPPLLSFKWGHFMEGKFVTQMLGTNAGIVVVFGVGICVLGIVLAAFAGGSKEREMSEEAKKETIKEFSFVKGLCVATFSGIMSACFNLGLDAAEPIADLSLAAGTPNEWALLPRLCIILAGGFTTNFLICLFLILKNKSGYQFLAKEIKVEHADSERKNDLKIPMLWNYVFAALAGTTWYFQFFFYSRGETEMGAFQFSSWPLHMASIMIFSSLWGLALREWKGSSAYTKTLLFATLATLIFSTVVIGYGTNMASLAEKAEFAQSVDSVKADARLIAAITPDKENPAKIMALMDDFVKISEDHKAAEKFDEKQKMLDEASSNVDGILAITGRIMQDYPDNEETLHLAKQINNRLNSALKLFPALEKKRKKTQASANN